MPISKSVKQIFSLNPVVGCTIGCPYCYARVFNAKYPQVAHWGEPRFFPERLQALYKRRSPSSFFLSTMNDPSDWKPEWVQLVLKAMKDNPRHSYLLLSKRPEKLLLGGESPNIWLGCTVTRADEKHRLDALRALPCLRRFVSFEPLLQDLGPLNLEGIDWLWLGAETGAHPNKTPCRREWVENIRAQSTAPCFLHRSLASIMPLDTSQYHPDFIIEEARLF